MGDFDYHLILPVLSLAAFGLLAMLLASTFRGNSRAAIFPAVAGILFSGFSLVRLWDRWLMDGPMTTAFEAVRVDGFGMFVAFLVLLTGLLTVLTSISFIEREGIDHGEFYALLMFCLAGMLIMLMTTHMMIILIGLEIFSLALYVLTGLTRGRVRSIEAALKYFLLGAFSSGFIVYGMALLYGATGSLDLGRIGHAASAQPTAMLWAGLGLVLVGLAFKIAIVPFHQWVPDVYTGAPTNVTGFMAAATKTVAFAVLLRLLIGSFGDVDGLWQPLIKWLAIFTMTVGNLVALAQTNLKRLLAFSSISHAGYLLIAVVCRPEMGVSAILFYLIGYSVVTVGAFAVLAAVGRGDADGERGYTLHEWAGLGWKRPLLGVAMTLFLLSLAGIPPTGGFLGKYVIFQAAIASEQYLLAVVGVLNAAIAAYYYLNVMVSMYFRQPADDEMPLPVAPGSAAVMVIAVVGLLYLGLAPGPILELIQTLAGSLL
ncbi:MAG: NADH-quinone oxidoreductase subunit N [Acidobacteriota bacterium]|nr:NADH-quinone oxidoreductase subunit N [Acidobacteriota bacterium]